MEFPSLGKQCNVAECLQLDFLPILCQHCKSNYCKDHFEVASHKCPACVIKKLTDVSSSNCQSFICSYINCNMKDATEMLCVKCHQHHCLTHRYHQCFSYTSDLIDESRRKIASDRENFNAAHREITAAVTSAIERCKASPKTSALAQKVQLMKLKGKAKGDSSIPILSRLYFNIFPPIRVKSGSTAVYVSKSWSVGRVIDAISSICRVPNNNNLATADKLRLFRKLDGVPITSDMALPISNFLDSAFIVDGDSIILEYQNVNELRENACLKCITDYLD